MQEPINSYEDFVEKLKNKPSSLQDHHFDLLSNTQKENLDRFFKTFNSSKLHINTWLTSPSLINHLNVELYNAVSNRSVLFKHDGSIFDTATNYTIDFNLLSRIFKRKTIPTPMSTLNTDIYLPNITFHIPTSRDEIVKQFQVPASSSTWDTLLNLLLREVDPETAKLCGSTLFLLVRRNGMFPKNFQAIGKFPKEYLVPTMKKYSLTFNPVTQKESDFYSLAAQKWFLSIAPFMQVIQEEQDTFILQINPKIIEEFEKFEDKENIKNFFVGANAMTGVSAFWSSALNTPNIKQLSVLINGVYFN